MSNYDVQKTCHTMKYSIFSWQTAFEKPKFIECDIKNTNLATPCIVRSQNGKF